MLTDELNAKDTGFGKAGKNQLKKSGPQFGIKIAAAETYDKKSTDLSAVVAKLKANQDIQKAYLGREGLLLFAKGGGETNFNSLVKNHFQRYSRVGGNPYILEITTHEANYVWHCILMFLIWSETFRFFP